MTLRQENDLEFLRTFYLFALAPKDEIRYENFAVIAWDMTIIKNTFLFLKKYAKGIFDGYDKSIQISWVVSYYGNVSLKMPNA